MQFHILTGCLLLAAIWTSPALARGFSTTQPGSAFVHLFEWRWTDIAQECENFLGPKGFSAVQISPPQEHAVIQGRPWYERYQPVSYRLESRSGTRAEFADMVRRCKAVGVSIYADAVINHMAWVNTSGSMQNGIAGSPFGYYSHPGLYSESDFHARECGRPIRRYECGDSADCNAVRWEIQACNIGEPGKECADLKTSSDYVQDRIALYLNDLLSLGVAGFRIDAAKHIPASDLQAIMSRLQKPAYSFLEVIRNDRGPISPKEYTGIGNVTEFKYSWDLGRMFRNGKLAWMQSFGEAWDFLRSEDAVVFTDNHDSQRSDAHQILTYKLGRRYILGNVFMLAWPYGTPALFSSYPFEDPQAGPPSNSKGETLPVYVNGNPSRCFHEWGCEHRLLPIANMVGFRKYTSNEKNVTKWWSDGNQRIAFARGNKGFVVINNDPQGFGRQFETGMPAGIYCDVTTGEPTPDLRGCTGRTVTVDYSGNAHIGLEGMDSVAIHGGAKLLGRW